MRSAPSRRSAGRRCSRTRSIRGGRSRDGAGDRGAASRSSPTTPPGTASCPIAPPARSSAPRRRCPGTVRGRCSRSPTTPQTSSRGSMRSAAPRARAAARACCSARPTRTATPGTARPSRRSRCACPWSAPATPTPTRGRSPRRSSTAAPPACSTASRPPDASGSCCPTTPASRCRSARRPTRARFSLLRDGRPAGALVPGADGAAFRCDGPCPPGDYRVEAWIEGRPWIFTNPVRIE